MALGELVPLGELDLAAEAPAPPAAATRPRLEAALGAALVLAVAALLVATSVAAYLRVPYADAHDWAYEVLRTERTGDWLGYLWTPHTEQRIPLARLAEALEVEVSRGGWPAFPVLAGGLWLAGAGVLASALVRSPRGEGRGRLRLWTAVAAGLVLTDVALAEDFAFPVFSVYLFVAGPALAACVLFARSEARGLRSPAFWAALACAGLAGLGNAAGLATWPALLACAALQPGGARRLTATLAAAALCIGLVQAGLGVPSTSLGAGGGGAGHLLKMATYFSAFAALPWSRAVHPTALGAGLGLFVWAAAAAVLRTAWRERGEAAPPLRNAGAALIVFGLFAAALAAVGRVDELPAPIVPTRYTPFAALLQVGVILGWGARFEAEGRRAGRARQAAGFAVAAVLVLAADVHAARFMPRVAGRIRAAGAVLDRGGVSTDVVLHPRPDFARAVRARLLARGLPG